MKPYVPANRSIDSKLNLISEKTSSATYAMDKVSQQNPQYVVEYVEEIFDYLRGEEVISSSSLEVLKLSHIYLE